MTPCDGGRSILDPASYAAATPDMPLQLPAADATGSARPVGGGWPAQ